LFSSAFSSTWTVYERTEIFSLQDDIGIITTFRPVWTGILWIPHSLENHWKQKPVIPTVRLVPSGMWKCWHHFPLWKTWLAPFHFLPRKVRFFIDHSHGLSFSRKAFPFNSTCPMLREMTASIQLRCYIATSGWRRE
jgi:hypothetical protein